jgi:hypothetical protein
VISIHAARIGSMLVEQMNFSSREANAVNDQFLAIKRLCQDGFTGTEG